MRARAGFGLMAAGLLLLSATTAVAQWWRQVPVIGSLESPSLAVGQSLELEWRIKSSEPEVFHRFEFDGDRVTCVRVALRDINALVFAWLRDDGGGALNDPHRFYNPNDVPSKPLTQRVFPGTYYLHLRPAHAGSAITYRLVITRTAC